MSDSDHPEEKITQMPAASVRDDVRTSADADLAIVEKRGTRIEIRSLDVHAGGRDLIRNTSADFAAGKVTLILGCSGVGKSILVRILAGLIESEHRTIKYSGRIRFVAADGTEWGPGDSGHSVAVVFQSFALLDELSPLQNVRIALDHSCAAPTAGSGSRYIGDAGATSLLSELRVPTDRPTAVLSGGQKQRLAIARAIGMSSDVILYDEPTSGLDVRTASQVADLIRETQQRHQRTSVIVTHDYETLSRIADHIIVLDHHQQRLTEIPRSEWHRLAESMGDPPLAEAAAHPDRGIRDLAGRFGRTVNDAILATGQFAEETLLLPWSLLPIWRSIPWGLRSTWHYLKLVSGWSACIYIAVSGMIIGFVAQDFIFRYLPFRQITEPLLTENLLHATGFSLFRFLVPILSTILISARSGAAVAADVGSKVYGNQIDAMRTIGMNPERSLRTPILYAFLIGTPLLTMISYFVASVTAAFAFLLTHPRLGIAFWDAHFHRYLIQPDQFFYQGSGWLLVKLLVCGAGIAMISWRCGIGPKLSGTEISRGVTRTILWATLFTLAVHFVFSLLEFKAPV